MKTSKTLTRQLFSVVFSLITIAILLLVQPAQAADLRPTQPDEAKDQNIMLALLLDTSNSMDGLIDQAKSQLWKIVNELAAAKCGDGSRPHIQIALYEYGNDGLPSAEGYIRLVSPLTTDLDLISLKLFSLTTNGGNEYCGQVIRTSLNQLAWSSSAADLKMIFIAGNEPFTQGQVPYQSACALAKEKGVVVNSIYCGDFNEGVETSWKHGAELTGGTYMSIQQDRKTVYVATPYDDRIAQLNDKLNDTYVYYGSSGSYKKEQQQVQDKNAESYGMANKVDRAVSKSSHAYVNSSWDLVDAMKDNDRVLSQTPEAELPQEMKGMKMEERKDYVSKKAKARSDIQNEMQQLNKQRQEYINSHTPKEADASMLDGAMIKAIKEQAKSKNLDW